MKRAFLVDRQFLARNAAKNLGRGADVDHRLGREAPERPKEPLGALDVGVQRVQRRRERGLRVALGRKMKHIVRPRGLDTILDRHRVAQVGIVKLDPAASVNVVEMAGNIVEGASPAKHAVNFPVGLLKKIVQ